MTTLAMSPSASACVTLVGHPLWTSVRFRRAKEAKGWVLLGIPSQVYPAVAMRLFERRARLLQKHDADAFTSLWFEAPSELAAQLALTFPAPPGCPTLAIAVSGDRILSGKAAQSAKAIQQALDPLHPGTAIADHETSAEN